MLAKHRYEGSVRRMPLQLLVDDMYGSPSNKGNRADWQNSWLTRIEDVYKASTSFGCRGTRGAHSSFAGGPSVKRHVQIALKQWFFRQSAYCCAQLIMMCISIENKGRPRKPWYIGLWQSTSAHDRPAHGQGLRTRRVDARVALCTGPEGPQKDRRCSSRRRSSRIVVSQPPEPEDPPKDPPRWES